MEALDTDGRAREIERDIDRTRDEMDQTLSALERRLAPSEIIHQGAQNLRDGVRDSVTRLLATLQRHPAEIALASAVIGATLALRPSAAARAERAAEQDFERAWGLLTTALEHAKTRSRRGATELAETTRDTLRRARDESLDVTRTLRAEAERKPLGAIVIAALALGVAAIASRGRSAWR